MSSRGHQQNRSFKQRLLHEAIKTEDYLKVESLLTSEVMTGVDISEDHCALELAVATGNANIVQLLVQSGCCVNKVKPNLVTAPPEHYECDSNFRAMDVAIYRSHNEIVEILQQAGFNIMKRNGFSESRLHVAACGDNDYILQKLLHAGLDADELTSSWTACHVLCARNHTKTLAVLLRYGCNLEARTNDGSNPLLLALTRNHFKPCYLLLHAGCDPRPLVHALGLTHDPEVDAETIADYVEDRQNSGPGVPRLAATPEQFRDEINKLSNFVRRRIFETPLSLKDISKFVVRRALRTNIERKSEELPLPAPLRKVVVDIFDDGVGDV